jgi:hypothetical protein
MKRLAWLVEHVCAALLGLAFAWMLVVCLSGGP